jgi:homogentisate 1,2-dioxygenase
MLKMCGAGEAEMKDGITIYTYAFNKNMNKGGKNTAFYSADGDWLIVPQQGKLFITTEFGRLIVGEREICVIPRGIKFMVDLEEEREGSFARGWICEIFKGHFNLPDLGPLGANGLANPMHFETPVSYFEEDSKYGEGDAKDWQIVCKYGGEYFVYSRTTLHLMSSPGEATTIRTSMIFKSSTLWAQSATIIRIRAFSPC